MPSDDKIKRIVQKVLMSLYLNLAQCYIKMKDYQNGLLSCNEALELEPSHTKALYSVPRFIDLDTGGRSAERWISIPGRRS